MSPAPRRYLDEPNEKPEIDFLQNIQPLTASAADGPALLLKIRRWLAKTVSTKHAHRRAHCREAEPVRAYFWLPRHSLEVVRH